MDEKNENTYSGMTLREALEAGLSGDNINTPVNAEAPATEAPATPETPIMQTEQSDVEQPTQEQVVGNQNVAGNIGVTSDPNSGLMNLINELRAQNANLVQQNGLLSQQLQSSNQAVSEQSQLAEEAVDNAAGISDVPVLNFEELQYKSTDEQNAAIAEWQSKIYQKAVNDAVAKMRGEISPIKEAYERETADAAKAAAKDRVYSDPRFSDFKSHDEDIDKIIGTIPEFNNMNPEQARILGGYIVRGMGYDPNKKMSSEELVAAVISNPDAMKALETRRAQEVLNKTGDLPVITASAGMTNAAPVPEHKPTTYGEMRKTIMSRLGIN